jgi:hypothetical protein
MSNKYLEKIASSGIEPATNAGEPTGSGTAASVLGLTGLGAVAHYGGSRLNQVIGSKLPAAPQAAKTIGEKALSMAHNPHARIAALGVPLGMAADYAGIKLHDFLTKKSSQNKSGIHIKKQNKGLLHKKLGIGQGKKISGHTLDAEKARAKKSGNTKLEREVVFAQNAKKWNHKK